MPRRRRSPVSSPSPFPEDFPQRLEAFKSASGLSWREMAYRLGVEPRFLRRWRAGMRPSAENLFNLMALAQDLSLGHLLAERGENGKAEETPRSNNSSR